MLTALLSLTALLAGPAQADESVPHELIEAPAPPVIPAGRLVEADGGGAREDTRSGGFGPGPRLRLGIWHSLNGAVWLAWPTEAAFWEPGLTWTAGTVGFVGGAASAFLARPEAGIDQARASAVITSEQLLMWNLGTLAAMPTEYGEAVPYGLAAGFLGGAVLGLTETTFPEASEHRLAWARTGMFTGLGVGALVLSATYYWTDVDARVVAAALLVPGDVGFLVGFLAQPDLGWSRNRARATNLGMVLGGVGAFVVPWSTQGQIVWDPALVGGVVGLGVVAGGLGGFVIHDRLSGRRGGRVALAGPLPTVGLSDDGQAQLQVSLLSGVF